MEEEKGRWRRGVRGGGWGEVLFIGEEEGGVSNGRGGGRLGAWFYKERVTVLAVILRLWEWVCRRGSDGEGRKGLLPIERKGRG